MKKYILSLIISFIGYYALWSAPVSPSSAMLAAQKFDASMTGSTGLSDVKLVYTKLTSKGENAFYIFNIDERGFVIIAAEDRQEPILGYSYSRLFEVQNMSPEINYFFDNYSEEIRFIINNNIEPESSTIEQWQILLSDSVVPYIMSNRSTTVGPLLTTCWGQNNPDNLECPINAGCQAVSGCVATAMSQIMNYWQYPTVGNGNNTYNRPPYGILTANFGATFYTWGGTNAERSRIMSDAGIAVNMEYTCTSSGAWVLLNDQFGSHPRAAQNAYTNHFRYDTGIQGVRRTNYSYNDWKDLMRSELDASRPIQYAGWGNSGGHTWVCDGYNQNFWGTKFHMNWGWNCSNDGMFRLGGVGGNQSYFPTNEQALINIKPLSCSSNLNIVNNVTVPNTDAQQTSSTINASNTVSNGAVAIYHAGDEVLLSNGFTSENGSVFRGYIEGCTDTYVARAIQNDGNTSNSDLGNVATLSVDNNLLIMPNPTFGKIIIQHARDTKQLKVYNMLGELILETNPNAQLSTEIDLSRYPQGLYIITDGTRKQKVIKQ